jgi:hypothetical protein
MPLWVADELHVAWRDGRDEALDAYAAWSETHEAGAYAVYLAAQDRADAAQNALAARSPTVPSGTERGTS